MGENNYDSLDDVLDKIHGTKTTFDTDELRDYLIGTVAGSQTPEPLIMKNAIDIYGKALLSYYLYDKPHNLTIDYDNNKVMIRRVD
ncbi:MAG: hypothetical protein ACTSU7_00305 [Candidatus Heimdallarchaeaceae archaeon]